MRSAVCRTSCLALVVLAAGRDGEAEHHQYDVVLHSTDLYGAARRDDMMGA